MTLEDCIFDRCHWACEGYVYECPYKKELNVSNAAKRKGSGAERDVVAWLKDNGYLYADRRLAGATLDKGDVSGIPGVTIEIKNHAKMDLAGWLAELEVEMKNDNAWTGVVIHKRKGKGDVGEWYASMPAKVWLSLLKKADGKA